MLGSFADLILENNSTARLFEKALLVGEGAGKRTFHVTKKQTLEQRLRQGAAVDRQKQAVAPVAMGVNGKGNQFFSCAAVTGDQNRGHSGRHFLNHLQDIPDRFALADNFFEVKFHLTFYAVMITFAIIDDSMGRVEYQYDRLELSRLCQSPSAAWRSSESEQNWRMANFSFCRCTLAGTPKFSMVLAIFGPPSWSSLP